AMETHRRNRDQWIPLQWDGEVLAAEKRKPENYGRFLWFNEEVQESHAKKYGKDSDFYRVRVKGLPPNQSGDTLIGFEWAMAATTRVIETLDTDPLAVAVDVGGPNRGGDPTIVVPMRGPQVLEIYEHTEKDTTQVTHLVAGHVKTHLANVPANVQYAIGVDVIGIGRGVRDSLVNIEKLRVFSIDVSQKPLNEARYHRLRDQIYWELREAFETGEISLRILRKGMPFVDDEAIGELTSIKWAEVEGKIKVQGKGLSSGIPHVPPLVNSPNKADGIAIAWWVYKHCTSKMPPGQRRQRRQRNANTDAALLGFRSMAARMWRGR
ncbi:MAG: hypothetical protein KF890_15810, partial [Nitrospira sp.]|nr:hypothetical protein [Nitrospira sp.]